MLIIFAIITEVAIGNETNPHLYSKQEVQMDKIVYSFKLLK